MLAKIIIFGLITGILLGFVLQRGRYCMVSAYRDVYLAKDRTLFTATFVAMAVQSIGIFALSAAHVITVPEVKFTWLAAIVGGFTFGIGIVLAGGCASGSWYRAGEGLLGSWIALIGYSIGAATMKFGALKPLYNWLNGPTTKDSTIYQTVHVSPWVPTAILVVSVSIALIVRGRRPKVVIPQLRPRKTGIAHLLFEKRWNANVTGLLVGLVAILAWPMSEATGRMYGLGITVPTGNWSQWLVTGNSKILNWAMFLVLGIGIGAFIAAKGAGEFKWRVPDARVVKRNLFGGVLMGFGAGIANGCNIGNGLVNASLFTWEGWITTPCIILGCWIGSYYILVRPNRSRMAATGSTARSA